MGFCLDPSCYARRLHLDFARAVHRDSLARAFEAVPIDVMATLGLNPQTAHLVLPLFTMVARVLVVSLGLEPYDDVADLMHHSLTARRL